MVTVPAPGAPSSIEPPQREPSAHAALCHLAQRWLMRPHSAGGHGCAFAITEGWGDGLGEHPDAIGWRRNPFDGGAILVEAKVSRSDFLADARKPHRLEPGQGVGRFRYYLCPEGLIAPDELPERWGLLYATTRGGVRAVVGPAAALRHHRRGEPERDAAGEPIWQHVAFRLACEAFAFEARNHDLETAMLVSLLQRVGDPEAANRRLREVRSHSAYLAKELQSAREQAKRLSWELFAARTLLDQAGLELPRMPTTTPEARRRVPANPSEAQTEPNFTAPTNG